MVKGRRLESCGKWPLPVAGFAKPSNEPAGSVKDNESLDQLFVQPASKQVWAPWSYLQKNCRCFCNFCLATAIMERSEHMFISVSIVHY
jgi:hypothetical protein